MKLIIDNIKKSDLLEMAELAGRRIKEHKDIYDHLRTIIVNLSDDEEITMRVDNKNIYEQCLGMILQGIYDSRTAKKQ